MPLIDIYHAANFHSKGFITVETIFRSRTYGPRCKRRVNATNF